MQKASEVQGDHKYLMHADRGTAASHCNSVASNAPGVQRAEAGDCCKQAGIVVA